MSDIDTLLDEYRAITEASREQEAAYHDAARQRGLVILRLRETGLSYAAIGVLVGLSRGRVAGLAAKASETTRQ